MLFPLPICSVFIRLVSALGDDVSDILLDHFDIAKNVTPKKTSPVQRTNAEQLI